MRAVYDQLLDLLQGVGTAFNRSDIRQRARSAGYKWNYSLITGACQPGALMIVGFNWGANAAEDYPPQNKIERSQWNKADLGSFARIPLYLARHFPNVSIDAASQTNYCFFRSKDERQISAGDLELCRPFFADLLRLMEPSLVLGFSSRLRDHLLDSGQVMRPATVKVKQQVGNSKVDPGIETVI